MTTKRLRLLGLTVTPSLVIDDGEHLEPVQVQPMNVRAADIDTFIADLRTQISNEESRLNSVEPDLDPIP